MIDVSNKIVTKLSTVLPTYYELFVDSSISKPCITYMLNNDYQDLTGDTLGYSRVRYTIKLWGDDLSVLIPKSLLVDSEMRSLGFKRISTNELTSDTQICKILVYEGLGIENFN